MTTLRDLYERMLLIRRFEERVLELFSQGKLSGTTHACIGQEHVSAGLFAHLTADDIVFSNHRCHGHYLAHQDDPDGLMAELMGKATGTCGGVGGSQHLHRGNFYSNGVQGGIVPAAVGMALAERLKGETRAIAVVFLGDGTLGQGQAYEAMNLASLWRLPVLFCIENNGYSQSTPSHLQIAGKIADRPRAFGIEVHEVTSNHVLESYLTAQEAVGQVRQGRRPVALIYHTFRLCSHSRSDDGRPESVIEPWRDRDPLRLAERELEDLTDVRARVEARIEEVVARAEAAPDPEPPGSWELPDLVRQYPGTAASGEKVVTALNRALHRLLQEDPRAVVLGMDILDPYGGAFKVEKGLSTAYPDRVLPTPVCEMSLTGLCGG
ncbi:MAG: thiamine pyrophosphate-dependent enzyme, partial [Candidatus Eremiobacterota bacterium]